MYLNGRFWNDNWVRLRNSTVAIDLKFSIHSEVALNIFKEGFYIETMVLVYFRAMVRTYIFRV